MEVLGERSRVTFAVKIRNNPDTNTLKLLYKGLELYRGPSILLGMPKGGLGEKRNAMSS